MTIITDIRLAQILSLENPLIFPHTMIMLLLVDLLADILTLSVKSSPTTSSLKHETYWEIVVPQVYLDRLLNVRRQHLKIKS
jgi:hypothetical protein